jgi:hypothetical protein
MAKVIYKNGVASVILRVLLLDNTSTTGAGKTGLTFSSGGLIISTIADNEATATTYTAAGSTTETITTLGTFAAPTATKCRFKEVDATNHPGLYEIQIADARWAVASARSIIVSVQATGVVPVFAEVQLSAADLNDSVRLGLTALPNAAAEASGGLYTRGNGAGQLNQQANGQLDANVARWLNTAPTTPNTAGQPLVDVNRVAGTAQTARDLGLALPAAAPQAAGGLITSAAGSLDMDDLAADVDAAETRVTLALPNAAPGAAGGLPVSTAGSLDLDDLAADVDAIETRVVLALPAVAPQGAGGLITSAAGSLDMDDLAADVDAIETRVTTALPNAAPQAAGGLVTSTAGALDLDEMNVDIEAIQAKTDQLTFTGANKLDASVRDWLGTAPAAVTTNGFLQTCLRRWLTDDAGGTPDALSSGKMPADLKLWLTVAPLALSSQMVQAIVEAYGASLAPLDAAGTRSAVGLATANLDTQLAEIEGETDDIAAVKAKTDTLPATPAAQSDCITAAGVRSAVGLASANLDTQLAEIEADVDLLPTAAQVDTQLSGTHGSGAWGAAGSGSGARVRTVTVTDGASPIENATVRLTIGLSTFTAPTDASGVATFNLDAGSYTLSITADGYSFGGDELTIPDADGNDDVVMVAIVIPIPSSPGQTIGTGLTFDAQGALAPHAVVWFSLAHQPAGAGQLYTNGRFSAESDDDAVVSAEFTKGALYAAYASATGAALLATFTAAKDEDDFTLPSLMGLGAP